MKAHLTERNLDTQKHSVWFLEDSTYAFPLWNLSGQLLGVHHYNPLGSKDNDNSLNGKYCTRVHNPHVVVWGLESWSFSNTLFLTEGLFDAAKVTWCGYSALALFGTTSVPNKNLLNWLWNVNQFRNVVALCDNDKQGSWLASYAAKSYQFKKFHDAGDAPVSFVYRLCQSFEERLPHPGE